MFTFAIAFLSFAIVPFGSSLRAIWHDAGAAVRTLPQRLPGQGLEKPCRDTPIRSFAALA
jgi:hypothetical protein